jgi:hypothetical protein
MGAKSPKQCTETKSHKERKHFFFCELVIICGGRGRNGYHQNFSSVNSHRKAAVVMSLWVSQGLKLWDVTLKHLILLLVLWASFQHSNLISSFIVKTCLWYCYVYVPIFYLSELLITICIICNFLLVFFLISYLIISHPSPTFACSVWMFLSGPPARSTWYIFNFSDSGTSADWRSSDRLLSRKC